MKEVVVMEVLSAGSGAGQGVVGSMPACHPTSCQGEEEKDRRHRCYQDVEEGQDR